MTLNISGTIDAVVTAFGGRTFKGKCKGSKPSSLR